jgi:hypothetical protein
MSFVSQHKKESKLWKELTKQQGKTPPNVMDARIEILNIAAGREFYKPLNTPAVAKRKRI